MTDMKIKAGLRKNMARGPLKAMPSTAVKQPQKSSDAVRSVFKRFHQNSICVWSIERIDQISHD